MERRIILLGKVGNGKSSTGNSILGENKFEAKQSLRSVTSGCRESKSIKRNSRPLYKVCDTPGLLCAGENFIDKALEVQRSVKICENPHAFLLVFSCANRTSEDEKYTLDILRIIFGEKIFEHCIVVFTRGNDFKNDTEFEQYWSDGPEIFKLATKCGKRVLKIENNTDRPENLVKGLDELLTMIEEVSKEGSRTYDYKWLNSHADELQKYRQEYKGSVPIWEHLTNLDKRLGSRLKSNVWKIGLYATIGAAATGGLGYATFAVGAAAMNSLPVIAANAATIAGGTTAAVVFNVAKGFVQHMKFW